MTTKPETMVHRTPGNQQQQPYGRHHSSDPHRSKRATKPLNFRQAMDDFQVMFPDIDRDVIETVLRANNGVVQSTIDQLLVLQESTPPINHDNDIIDDDDKDELDFPPIPSYEHAIIDHLNEPPPAYSAIWRDKNNSPPKNETIKTENKPTKTQQFSRADSIKQQSLLIANSHWKAPLVGALSDDFLRIEPVEEQVTGLNINRTNTNEYPRIHSSSSRRSRTSNNTQKDDTNKLDEDEKLALFLQNEEFLQELRRNREFVESLEMANGGVVNPESEKGFDDYDEWSKNYDHRKALQRERGTGGPPRTIDDTLSSFTITSPPAESVPNGGARPRTTQPPPPVHDDQAFKQKLKHMGKSTKKKFSKVAKRFSRGQGGSNRGQLTHASNSSFTLLNEEDDDIDFDDIRGVHDEDIGAISEESDEDKLNRPSTMTRQTQGGTGRQLPQINDPQNRLSSTNNHASGEAGRQLPQPPGDGHLGNTEPIVFYDEDNEFEYKKE